ncbi:hypothetical protein [Lacibacter sediminis]|uniref:Uncharacterized protein n=1 Tax=Lacibacter sediminis TaxID=2760713 RepID=A0A7G5XC47_9BACT|nr:hypothetical protein [Lacibacter sediminis]QNA43050.1 hypothetical protein H4075_13250 [Lacibacter sediminis]
MSVKAAFKYCLFLLFVFAFSLQQFSAFAYTQLAANTTKENGSHLHSQRIFSNAQLSYHLPFQPNPLEWEMEFVEEDDEHNNRKISVDDYRTQFSKTHSSDELAYATGLKSRYLQLTSSVSKRPSIPFFILYHSWKSHLS